MSSPAFFQSRPAATSAMNRNLASAFASSTALRAENMRCSPLVGLSVSNSRRQRCEAQIPAADGHGRDERRDQVSPRTGSARQQGVQHIVAEHGERTALIERFLARQGEARAHDVRRAARRCRPPSMYSPRAREQHDRRGAEVRGTRDLALLAGLLQPFLVGCSVRSWSLSPPSAMSASHSRQGANQHEGLLQQCDEARLHGGQAERARCTSPKTSVTREVQQRTDSAWARRGSSRRRRGSR